MPPVCPWQPQACWQVRLVQGQQPGWAQQKQERGQSPGPGCEAQLCRQALQRRRRRCRHLHCHLALLIDRQSVWRKSCCGMGPSGLLLRS